MSNGLVSDLDRHFVGPDLGPNCLQRLSVEDKSMIMVIRPGNSQNACRKSTFFKKIFQEYYQSVKQFGSRSGPKFFQSWPEVIKNFMLSSTEQKISTAHKN